MQKKYQKLLKQNKLWAIAGLILPTLSTFFMIFLILLGPNELAEIVAIVIATAFIGISSYWWWSTMFQIYQFIKISQKNEKNITELGNKVQNLKKDVNFF